MKNIRDERCLAFPNEPYSAYCKVCWYSVYKGWIDENDPHNGACITGCTVAHQCDYAVKRAQEAAQLWEALKA